MNNHSIINMLSTYKKKPAINLNGFAVEGWSAIISVLASHTRKNSTIVVDCYTGVNQEELEKWLIQLKPDVFIHTKDLFIPEEEVGALTARFMTEDTLFGYNSNITLDEYFDQEKLNAAREAATMPGGRVLVLGPGAQLVAEADMLIYADMPRWEIQQRMRQGVASGLGIDNSREPFSQQYKRGLFNDWRVLDKHKCLIFDKVDFWLDTVVHGAPKMIDRQTFNAGMDKAATSPFRVVPFFDPAPWGGQWMKEEFALDPSKVNYGWGFDCVPEENSLLLNVNNIVFEMPAVNLVYTKSSEVLGRPVEARFGKDFPIRFDFLDTIGGGNLSLQVHPTTQYARDHFGLHYTQDESYYIMAAKDDAHVYLGFKTGVDRDVVIDELEKAERGELVFDADKYVNKIPTKKHDHFLIPAGTIHCSGTNAVVLEISSTPNLFTFKLWDWQRLGLDGKPRPINVKRGKHVLNWSCDTEYTYAQLVNHVEVINSGEGWVEERTGLHKSEFIETRRHTFSVPVTHYTGDSVNVLNLVDGEEIIVESPTGAFEPMIIHYAETFIVPSAVGAYRIRPHGASAGKTCMTIKASVRV
ncbi:mannose-6-phosphate isomerase class I [Sphingobacterium allocomposti]|uniref:Mannose-6-phosphate isomerase class I n=1 Tax=Sphingobacterium allocomposti TaxID=415956 RepID=A0A5S5DH69_9SPHI|nr:class I mannose-6-phosphate isomerase [Sphingobacterium composti Yoo et al. 2007 non Ten et al. 2007]TYP94698.1 mannose-6-phosphate isomerase class I [Sphingobacterium composti Yoo et al. 2007 non Ten et al. 2007]